MPEMAYAPALVPEPARGFARWWGGCRRLIGSVSVGTTATIRLSRSRRLGLRQRRDRVRGQGTDAKLLARSGKEVEGGRARCHANGHLKRFVDQFRGSWLAIAAIEPDRYGILAVELERLPRGDHLRLAIDIALEITTVGRVVDDNRDRRLRQLPGPIFDREPVHAWVQPVFLIAQRSRPGCR